MTPDQLRRRALASGAEVEIDGRVFNAARAKVAARPRVDPAPQPPVSAPAPPAAAPGITREEVVALLDARDAAWQALFAELGASVVALRNQKPPRYDFDFTYDERGMITSGKATPK